MKFIATFFIVVSVIHCSYTQTTTLVRSPSLDSAFSNVVRNGNSYSYSILQNDAYLPVSSVLQYNSPLYGQQILNPYQSYPIYTPILGQYPGYPIQQNPGYPIQQNPIQIGGFPGYPTYPGVSPIQQQPVQIGGVGGIPGYPGVGGIGGSPNPPSLSPMPVQGTIIDDDTVAVDAA